jgi:protein O-GlcNAc transferase
MSALDALIEQAIAFHESGHFEQAEALYLQVLRSEPRDAEAQHLLGMMRCQQGRFEDALALVQQALAIKPRGPHILATQGMVLHRLQQYEAALASYDKALEISPAFPDALNNRGLVLKDLGRFEQALECYDKVLAAAPDYPEALNNRGIVLRHLRRFSEALAHYDRVLQARPNDPEALNHRGNVLLDMKRPAEALASYDLALLLRPNNVAALNNRGSALKDLGRLDEAVASYDRALAIDPDDVGALTNRGLALKELKRFDDAQASLVRALMLRPDNAEAYFNLGGIHEEFNRGQDAVQCYQKALDLKPSFASARFALCMAELPILYASEDEVAACRLAYGRRLEQLRDDVDDGRVGDELVDAVGHRQPFYLAYQGNNDRDLQRLYGSIVCRSVGERFPPAAHPASRQAAGPLTVGIVSGHFYNHTVWKLMVRGWVSQFDRQRIRVIGYHTGTIRDSYTDAAAALCDRFVRGPMSIEEWRRTILADKPDALIYPEIGMDPVAVGLAAQRLAAVQCNSWGHPETSGFPTLDYFLSSELMEPPDGDGHYTEQLVRLPNLSIYYEPLEIPPLAMTRADLGLRPSATVYWCGQSLFKYLPRFDSVFAQIASGVGDCQFAFIQHSGAKPVTDLFAERLERAFAECGLQARDHCVFLPRLDMQQFVAAIGLCDGVLDSIGWSGGNTTLESLAHDPAIVTMPTNLMRGRHTAGILKMMNVTETTAATIEEYVAIAVRLARDHTWRASVKRAMAAGKQALYRDKVTVRALEEFLERTVSASGAG